jgi:hypothetical protein
MPSFGNIAPRLRIALSGILLFGLCFAPAAHSQVRTPAHLWIKESPWSPPGTNKIAFAHGKFHSVSVDGGFYTSTDGVRWDRHLDVPGYVRPAACVREVNNDVLIGFYPSEVAWVRADGSFELAANSTKRPVSDAAFGNGIYVLTQPGGTGADGILTSADGLNWIERDGRESRTSVTFGVGVFVAVGGTNAATSNDGINWEPRDSGQTNLLSSVRFGAGKFVAVGNNGTIITSPDGQSWEKQTSGITNRIRSVAFANGLFIAAASSVVTVSPDGVIWTPKSISPNSVVEAAFGNGRFVGAHMVAPETSVSLDGLSWEKADASNVRGLGVAVWKNQFILGNPYDLWSSSNRVNWTSTNQFGATQFAYNDSVIIGSMNLRDYGAARSIYSLDGVKWSRSSISPAAVVYGERGFVALRNSAWRSADGINWDESTTTAAASISLCAAYGAGFYVAGGVGGSLQRSMDGGTWELLNSGVTNDITGLTFANGVFVATGPGGLILTSPNSVQWSRAESSTTHDLSAPAFAHNIWVIVGSKNATNIFKLPADSIVLTSTNAVDWEISPSKPEQPLYAVAPTSDGFYAVGHGTFRSGYFGPAFFAGLTAGSNVDLQVHGQIGKTYQLQSADALGSAEWRNVGPVVQTGEVQSVTDDAPIRSTRFYRLLE